MINNNKMIVRDRKTKEELVNTLRREIRRAAKTKCDIILGGLGVEGLNSVNIFGAKSGVEVNVKLKKYDKINDVDKEENMFTISYVEIRERGIDDIPDEIITDICNYQWGLINCWFVVGGVYVIQGGGNYTYCIRSHYFRGGDGIQYYILREVETGEEYIGKQMCGTSSIWLGGGWIDPDFRVDNKVENKQIW